MIRPHGAAALLALCVGASVAAGTEGAMSAPAPGPLPVYAPAEDRLLVGIVIHGRELATLEVLRDGEFLLPFDEFVALTGITVVEAPTRLTLVTPIGRVELHRDELVERSGVQFLPESFIEAKLASPVSFDVEEFALIVDLPWSTPSERRPQAVAERLVPDVRPPPLSLSTLRFDGQYVDSSIAGESEFANALLAGRAGPGRWQVRTTTSFEGETRWQDYAWVTAQRRSLWLVGHQRVSLHPVLPVVEVTGVQAALTNQSLSLFSRRYEPGELLPRRLRPVDSFTGTGPPAGVAELRIDGAVVARQTISLSGLWAFYEVPVRSFQHSRIEVWLYERHNVLVPVEVQDRTRAASAFLLPKGAWVHQGGAGYDGNLVQDVIDEREDSDWAGFYQARHGLTSGLTLETAVQSRPDRLQAMAGLVARPWRGLIVSAAPAVADGAFGWHVELDGRRPEWYLRGFSRYHEAGFLTELSLESFDHYLEVGHIPGPTLDVSLIGRSREEAGVRTDYVRPALRWSPSPAVSLQARPDEYGDYIANFQYRHRDLARLSVSYQDRTYADLSMWPWDRTSVFVGAEFGGPLPDRYSLAAQYLAGGALRPTILAGPLYSEGELGYQIKTSATLAPGMLLRIEYEDDPLPVYSGERERRFFVGLNADLTWAQGRVMPASTRGIREDRGGIAGVVVVERAPAGMQYTLEGLTILVDGRAMATTTRGGRFYVSNLPEGVFEVRLDTEKLPIELQPVRDTVAAQVAGGAVTRLSFTVRPEYGIAGRLSDRFGRRLEDITVELLGSDGAAVGRGVSDRFGLYRIDRLPPGTYTLRVAPGQLPGVELPTREVVVSDDFLFGQDLQLPLELSDVDPEAAPPSAP